MKVPWKHRRESLGGLNPLIISLLLHYSYDVTIYFPLKATNGGAPNHQF
jgi:hypothetical protein